MQLDPLRCAASGNSENYNYGFQYQLTKDTLIEAYYVDSLGRELITSADVELPAAGDFAATAQQ